MSDKHEANEQAGEIKVKDRRHHADEQKDDAELGSAETRAFQAETKQLLELMIHSLYSNKEIFLRELISNASDALDALRFEAVTKPELQSDAEPEIRLSLDKDGRTLTIADNGIGMSRDEVVANIGTIAKSGTRELLERVKASAAAGGSDDDTVQLIGQFGVGFYSAFMVAERVTLVTRRAGEEAASRWQSRADGTYTLSEGERDGSGTTITLDLRDVDADDGLEDFTDAAMVRRVVKKYSDFVRYPVKLGDDTLNSMKALWKRRRADVSDEEYTAFYKSLSWDFDDPLETITFSAEGRLEYQALLFIPTRAPSDMFYQDAKFGLQLYVKNVRIMERCEALLPTWMRFVRGVVESADLSLNVSREILQQDQQIAAMRRALTKKVIDALAKMQKDDAERYGKFWGEMGRALKEGVSADADSREKLLPLLMFESSARDAGELTTLAEYIERMKDEQEAIYYLTAESRAIAERSPHLEAFKDKGYEVLLLVDPVDELLTQVLSEHEGKPLKSVGKGEVELGDAEEREAKEKAREAQQEQAGELLAAIKLVLEERVNEVRLSNRLTSSPACLVGGEGDLSPHIARMLSKRQGVQLPQMKRVLELNAEHAIFEAMQRRFAEKSDDPLVKQYAELLYGQALLAEGSELPDPPAFAKLLADLMVRAA